MCNNKKQRTMRKVNLTEEEEMIFLNAKVEEKDIQKLMKKYSIKTINNVNYVLRKRTRNGMEDANFMNTKLALTGILQEGETLHDFAEFRLRFRPVIEFRNRDFIIDEIKRKIRRNETK